MTSHGNWGKRHKRPNPVFRFFKEAEVGNSNNGFREMVCQVQREDSNDIDDTPEICGTKIRISTDGNKDSGGMTSNLKRHLKRHHPNEHEVVQKEIADSVPPSKKPKAKKIKKIASTQVRFIFWQILI